jgi:hypothetical protein
MVCARLAEVNALPQESTGFILEGFTHCSIVVSWDIHKLLATTLKVCQMRAVTRRRDSSATLAEVQKLCSKACEVFHSINLTNKWNIPQNHYADAFDTTCYNCGSPDHTSNKCPLLCNKATILKVKEPPVLRLSRKVVAVVMVVVVAVVVVARREVRAVIVQTHGINGMQMVSPQTLVQKNLQLMELTRGMILG